MTRIIEGLKYVAKAVTAAVAPLLTVWVTDALAEFQTIAQAGIAAAVAAVAVFLIPNGPKPS